MFKKSGFKPTRENMKSAGGFSDSSAVADGASGSKRKKFSAALKSKVKKPTMHSGMKNLMKGM